MTVWKCSSALCWLTASVDNGDAGRCVMRSLTMSWYAVLNVNFHIARSCKRGLFRSLFR